MKPQNKSKKRVSIKQKLNFLLNFILIISLTIQSCIFTMNQEQDFNDIIEKINNTDLKNSEQEITSFCIWPSNLEENNNETEVQKKSFFFELVNKSSRDLYISILNGNKFFIPKKLVGSFTNLNYSCATAIIADKSTPLFIYIWLTEPKTPLIKSRVNKPDIIYKINFISNETIFLKWNEDLEPQTGGGFFGVNNLNYISRSIIGYNSTTRTSYTLQKKFDINTNVKKEDIEIIKDTRKNDF